ncbi:hypothetical protein C8R47DRAFT_1080026 [Mycena vitilis]|nr:hypothetical protein C8R47DRAFT_1080026 [Mycena vitilis]
MAEALYSSLAHDVGRRRGYVLAVATSTTDRTPPLPLLPSNPAHGLQRRMLESCDVCGFAPPCTLWIAVQMKGHRNVAQGRLLLNSAPRARYAKLAGTAAPRSDGGTLSACGDVHPGLYLYPSRTDLIWTDLDQELASNSLNVVGAKCPVQKIMGEPAEVAGPDAIILSAQLLT